MKKLVLFISLSFVTGFVYAQSCQANYTHTELALTVSFVDSSYGSTTPTNWSWDFGDGTTSAQQNPAHTYSQAGTYVVCLATYKPFTNCQSTFCDSVIVGNGNCQAYFIHTLDSLNPNKINFIDSSLATVINTWQWDFGDAANGNSQNPSHIYAAAGDYYVCLTTIDSLGCTNTYCDSLTIGSSTGNCISNFTHFVDFINPNMIHFSDNSSQQIPLYTVWNFDDSTIDSLQNPVHIFANTGTFTVCLTIADSNGCSNTSCQQIWIGPISCSSSFDFFPDPANLLTLNFSDLSAGNATDWYWEFGDGNTAITQNSTHTFNSTGAYDICLTIFDSVSNCFDSYCQNIEVSKCYASYSNTPDNANPYTIHFTDNSLGDPTEWLWDFEDGTTSTLQNPVHTYPFDGWHWVCLTTYNSINSCTNTFCDFIYAGSPSSCYEYWELSPDSTDQLTINFYNYSWGTPPTDWLWTFGDGDSSNLPNPVHTYDTVGYYWVCCTISDSTGNCSFTHCYNLNVGDNSNCSANFTHSNVSGNFVSFTPGVPSNSATYSWDFGVWGVSIQQNPSNDFQGPGTYYVCLTVSDSGCTNTYCDSVTINSVGMEDLLMQNNFIVYPNPTSNNLIIRNTSPNSGTVTLSIFNPIGEIIEQRTMSGGSETIDLSDKASGLYSLKLQNSKSVIYQKVMIVK